MDKSPTSWPEDGLETVTHCPVCGSRESEILYTGLTDRIFFCAPGEWTMRKCTGCSSGYLNPRPTEDTIGIAYERYFTHQSGQADSRTGASAAQRLRWALGNGYRNWRFGTRFKPAMWLGVLFVLLNPTKQRKIDSSMRNLPRPRAGQVLFDFGCGNGDFLGVAKAAGWEVMGMDLDPQAVSAARANGYQVHQGGIEALANLPEQFDMITLSHVIEHVHSPERLLKVCYGRLKPGGILWIETPNLDSQGHHLYGRHWRGLEPPRHLVIFNVASLQALISRVAFKLVAHQPEHPVIPNIFVQSEAIQAGDDPINQISKRTRNMKGAWRKERKASQKDVKIREFITMAARK